METVTAVHPTRGNFLLGHNRALDGLRGVAVSCVVASHAGLIHGGFNGIAVDVFFVLSGFLITYLMVKEWEETNKISLRNFYLRRALRLLPALIVLLAVFTSYKVLTVSAPLATKCVYEAIRALFYLTNWSIVFDFGHTDYLWHTWSLSVEEQFYLLWPLMLVVLLGRVSRQLLLKWVALGVFASYLTRVLLFAGTSASPQRLLFGTDTRADSFLLGCLVSLAVTCNLHGKYPQAVRVLKYVSLPSAIGLAALGFLPAPALYCVGLFLASVFAAAVIASLITTSGGLLRLFLELPLLRYLGRISYGLYLWHYPIFRAFQDQNSPWGNHPVIGIAIAIGASLLSYYLIELPFLRLKKRFQTGIPERDQSIGLIDPVTYPK